jgi:sigma-B regulation protein RsbU (phosphoserine phosphatase)
MMQEALQGPSADEEITVDQWGTWLSGYAPLFDDDGEVIGILGVDLSQEDLRRTLLKIRVASSGAWLVIAVLITLAFVFLSQRVQAFDQLRRQDMLLQQQNDQLRLTNQSLADANHQFAKQLELAQRVQRRFLPAEFPRADRVAFGSIYIACEAVGGDLYDVFPIDDSHIGLYIADVSGHGISAALIGATLKMSVEAMKTRHADLAPVGGANGSPLLRPSELVMTLNGIISENLDRDQFITMQYAVISIRSGAMTLCNAGHTWPVLWRAADGRAELIETSSGLPIGFVVESVLSEQRIELAPGDKIVLYTDGLTETESPTGEMFGDERLAAAVASHGREGAQGLVAKIKETADAFAQGHPSADDVALVVAEILPTP